MSEEIVEYEQIKKLFRTTLGHIHLIGSSVSAFILGYIFLLSWIRRAEALLLSLSYLNKSSSNHSQESPIPNGSQPDEYNRTS